ncbi:HD domain-containing protein [Paenibacillus sp. IB182496]|uniref:HD domain-containing protein n=2 Tax=Paenibacillus sabuli TaxID=2772509 RepID=A0A927GRR6_9BACL|nr:HD domain-containing protein [Paenibacillus sabuli]
MIATKDIYNSEGKVLIAKGVKLTERYLNRLKNFNITEIEVREEPGDVGETIALSLDPITLTRDELELLVNQSIRRLIKPDAKKQDLRLLVEEVFEEILRDHALLNVMFKIKLTGDTTFFHAVQVAVLSVSTGMQMELGKTPLVQLGKAALMCDFGKCFLDRELLHHIGTYDARQATMMHEHTIAGYMFLKNEFAEEIALGALQHHERFNGSGYPQHLHNDKMHLYARIISVSDVYMALRSHRAYRAAYQPYEAIEYILGAGDYLFDSRVVNSFNEIVIIYPLGSVVQLNDGRAGLVTGTRATYSQRPEITLMFDKQMMPIQHDVMDLTVHPTAFITRVLHE